MRVWATRDMVFAVCLEQEHARAEVQDSTVCMEEAPLCDGLCVYARSGPPGLSTAAASVLTGCDGGGHWEALFLALPFASPRESAARTHRPPPYSTCSRRSRFSSTVDHRRTRWPQSCHPLFPAFLLLVFLLLSRGPTMGAGIPYDQLAMPGISITYVHGWPPSPSRRLRDRDGEATHRVLDVGSDGQCTS